MARPLIKVPEMDEAEIARYTSHYVARSPEEGTQVRPRSSRSATVEETWKRTLWGSDAEQLGGLSKQGRWAPNTLPRSAVLSLGVGERGRRVGAHKLACSFTVRLQRFFSKAADVLRFHYDGQRARVLVNTLHLSPFPRARRHCHFSASRRDESRSKTGARTFQSVSAVPRRRRAAHFKTREAQTGSVFGSQNPPLLAFPLPPWLFLLGLIASVGTNSSDRAQAAVMDVGRPSGATHARVVRSREFRGSVSGNAARLSHGMPPHFEEAGRLRVPCSITFLDGDLRDGAIVTVFDIASVYSQAPLTLAYIINVVPLAAEEYGSGTGFWLPLHSLVQDYAQVADPHPHCEAGTGECHRHPATIMIDSEFGEPQSCSLAGSGEEEVSKETACIPLPRYYAEDYQYDSESCHLQRCLDVSAPVGCVSGGQEAENRELVDRFAARYGNNHLLLNVAKTKEMDVDFLRNGTAPNTISFRGEETPISAPLGLHWGSSVPLCHRLQILKGNTAASLRTPAHVGRRSPHLQCCRTRPHSSRRTPGPTAHRRSAPRPIVCHSRASGLRRGTPWTHHCGRKPPSLFLFMTWKKQPNVFPFPVWKPPPNLLLFRFPAWRMPLILSPRLEPGQSQWLHLEALPCPYWLLHVNSNADSPLQYFNKDFFWQSEECHSPLVPFSLYSDHNSSLPTWTPSTPLNTMGQDVELVDIFKYLDVNLSTG
ncbi:hypothetical protein P4O66_004259 [Electrophorus voltai]|uniref:Reverse transcriptase domain-containing protein n=1 Tax=Electrophorus voltai TaxID=2609070 RepID=A0AAD8ZPQ3_9TELE|nr:hypothetical protein P4O66_004259 [Electrophorus voltai]